MNARRIVLLAAWIALSASFAQAGSITYVCDSQLSSDGTCGVLNSTIAALYGSTFSNANALLYVQYGSTDLASNIQYLTNVPYSTYASALQSNASDSLQSQAVNSLGDLTNNPVVSGSGVSLSSALASALGLTSVAGSTGIEPGSDASCILGDSNCYNDIITVSNEAQWFYRTSPTELSYQFDIYSAIEHETNEALGTSSCIPNAGTPPDSIGAGCENGMNGNPTEAVSAADLFRFSAPGIRSFLNNDNYCPLSPTPIGSPAYFSFDGGITSIAAYDNCPNGGDYGDWDSAQIRVQNAFGSAGNDGYIDITNDGGSEIALLNTVGYNSNLVPEPATWLMSATGLLIGFGIRRWFVRSKSLVNSREQ